MASRVYHWKHGWIPLDHEAAVEKRHGKSLDPVSRAALPRADHVIAAHSSSTNRFVVYDTKTKKTTTIGHTQASGLQSGGHTITEVHADGVFATRKGNATTRHSSAGLPADTVKDLRGGSADKHLVTDSSGTHFTPERAALHDRIIEKIVDGHKAQENPAFVMLGGGPASGKTKAADAAAKEFPDAVKIDPDEIKKMLPEYAQMTPEQAAAFVHEESSYLAKRAMDAALQSRSHIVLDAVGNNSADSVRGKIDKARSAGYSAHGRYVTVPTEVAQARAHARGVKSGRVVHPDVVAKLHGGVSSVFPQVMHDFDSAALYDNTAEWKAVLTKYRGQPEILHDLEAWRAFLQKGKRV